MALTLNDVLAAPTDPEELNKHLMANGFVPPPPPPAVIPAIAPFHGGSAADPSRFALGMTSKPTNPGHVTDPDLAASAPAIPDLPGSAAPAPMGGGSSSGPIPSLGYKDKLALPTTSAGVTPGSSQFYKNEVERAELAKANPWGSEENHPGLIGKIGHGLAKAGNVALDVLAPGIAALVPGTELNRSIGEKESLANLGEAQKREGAQRVEEARERHEETVEDQNQRKLDQADQKLDEEHLKNLGTRELALRKQGLKMDPANPEGAPIALKYEDMSPTEQAVYDLKTAQAGAQDAKAALDKIKADPNSPQSKATLERIRVMAQNAATAAGKLGLDKEKFVADYFGLDKDGNPIAGTQVTPEGKPIGPKVAGTTQHALTSFNKDYVKPANDVEKSYQMYQNAYRDHQAGKDDTGAPGMLALSTHLATTFGTVKGARVTKDMIEHHLKARNVSDEMEVAVNKLVNGDPLSDSQWKAFNQLISESRGLSWKTAVKEARRANLPVNFLPDDLTQSLGGAPVPAVVPPAGGGTPGGVPGFAEWNKNRQKPPS